MDNFISKVAQFIAEHHTNYAHLTVVLPSRRAQKYIQQELYRLHGHPIFSPNFITIDQFAKSLIDEELIDSMDLLFRFYKVFTSLGNNEDFETFLNWAPMLIADCNEIDRYLVDANQLFRNLRDVKELENWSFEQGRTLSESQKRFLDFWDQLKSYYEIINAELEQSGLVYSGAVFRKALEKFDEKIDLTYPNQSFLFAGFNALSESETQLMERLVKRGRAHVLAEADSFYMNNPNHEAGLFIRKTKDRIPEMQIMLSESLTQGAKQIELIECAQAGSMLKVTQDLLAKMSPSELNSTVLLLADESLIVPAIKHLPKSIEKANITLGLPLKLTALRPWLELIFEFQNNFLYFNTDAQYHKTLLAFFRHPFMERFLSDSDRKLVLLEERNIVKFNKIFTKLKTDEFSENVQLVLKKVFAPWKNDFSQALRIILELNQSVFDALSESDDLVERSALFHFQESMKPLQLVFERDYVPEMTLRSFEKFFNMRWMRESVAYYGNPIDGLQVMGLLETRLLSFKNLIVVGLNEGIMPPKNNINSLIPMDLRRYFQLPLPTEKDALFAHHFYRLLADAENIHILYSTNQGDDISAAEPSRYIKQIELELAGQNRQIQVNKTSYNIPVNLSVDELSFENSEVIQQRVLDQFEHGFSPSAMNKFLSCPLDYYFRYVLKYADDEDVEENVEHSTFGTVVHEVLEFLYLPFVGAPSIRIEDIRQMLQICNAEVDKRFKAKFESNVELFERGAMYFASIAAKNQIRRFLNQEIKLLAENSDKTLKIIALEQKLEHELSINFEGETRKIKLSGFIDRLDQWGDQIRIVDYKTGACKPEDVRVSGTVAAKIFKVIQDSGELNADALSEFGNLGARHAIQLLFYAVLYRANYGKVPDLVGIYSLRNVNAGLQCLDFAQPRKKADAHDLSLDDPLILFMEGFMQLVAQQILEIEVFEHDESSQYCKFCNS
jgi:ATP-dependent helicase/nuclease subunit B